MLWTIYNWNLKLKYKWQFLSTFLLTLKSAQNRLYYFFEEQFQRNFMRTLILEWETNYFKSAASVGLIIFVVT